MLPMGVANDSLGGVGRADLCSGTPDSRGTLEFCCPSFKGLTLGDGGMASPSLGVRAPPPRFPGMGGRSNGAGEDMFGL